MPIDLPKAMLIDLDDTIISYSTHSEPCWKAACDRFAPCAPGLSPQDLYATVRDTRIWFWSDPKRHLENRLDMRRAQRRVVTEALRRLEIVNSDMANGIADAFADARQKVIKPFPGAIETLVRLREHGVSLALITNGAADPQRDKIDRFDLAPCFHAILIEGELGYGKPDERVYRRALDLLGVTASDAWVVGDNLDWEVAVPQKLGIYSIWHDPTGEGLPESTAIRPDRIIRSLPELLEA